MGRMGRGGSEVKGGDWGGSEGWGGNVARSENIISTSLQRITMNNNKLAHIDEITASVTALEHS